MSLYIGVDIGGTTIKGVVTDESGKLYGESSVPSAKGESIAENVIMLCNKLSAEFEGKIKGVGIGCAGVIDGANGVVVKANNLGLTNFPLAKIVGERLNIPVKMTNDANAAALGEAKFGAGKEYSDSIFVTLGTGVGGGVVIGGKLFEGNKSAGAEIGHMVIVKGGARCSCGRLGCFETYASATALNNRTKWAMEENPGSAMWQVCTSEDATGKVAFDLKDVDIAANEVVEWYIKNLACGLVNLANIFRPQVIILGGGVSAQKEKLTIPLQAILDREVFAAQYAPVKVICAALGTAAGGFGAAALFFEDQL